MINCEATLILTWSENCFLSDIKTQTARGTRVATNAPTNVTSKIADAKFNVPVATLSTENDKTLLEQLRIGFKRTIKWNKHRSEMTKQTQNNNLNYLIDPTFTKVKGFCIIMKMKMKTIEDFKTEDNRRSFSKYHVPNVQIKDFNVLIDGDTNKK